MSNNNTDTVWIGMDVHQDSITAAILFGQDSSPQIERLPGGRSIQETGRDPTTRTFPPGRAATRCADEAPDSESSCYSRPSVYRWQK